VGRWRDSTEEEGGALWLGGWGKWVNQPAFLGGRCYGGDIAKVGGWAVGMDPGNQIMNEKKHAVFAFGLS